MKVITRTLDYYGDGSYGDRGYEEQFRREHGRYDRTRVGSVILVGSNLMGWNHEEPPGEDLVALYRELKSEYRKMARQVKVNHRWYKMFSKAQTCHSPSEY